VIAFADEFVEFSLCQPLFVQIACFQFGAHLQQETSCFAARRSRRLLQKLNFHLWQGFHLRKRLLLFAGAQHAAPFQQGRS
jgi:hypothetical protein